MLIIYRHTSSCLSTIPITQKQQVNNHHIQVWLCIYSQIYHGTWSLRIQQRLDLKLDNKHKQTVDNRLQKQKWILYSNCITQFWIPYKSSSPFLCSVGFHMKKIMIMSLFSFFRFHIQCPCNCASYICNVPGVDKNCSSTKRLGCTGKLHETYQTSGVRSTLYIFSYMKEICKYDLSVPEMNDFNKSALEL